MGGENKKDSIKERLVQYKKNKAKYLADYVEKIVKYKKERAKDLGILKIFERLYEIISYYSSWIKNKHSQDISFLITDVVELEDGVVSIKLKHREYTFEFVKNNFVGNWNLYSEYGLTRLLSVNMYYEYGHWYAVDIEAFVEGDWIQDFKDLYERIEIEDKVKNEKEKEKRNSERTNKLKGNFGIE